MIEIKYIDGIIMEQDKDFKEWFDNTTVIELGCTNCYMQNHLQVPYVCNCACHKKEYAKAGWDAATAKIIKKSEENLKRFRETKNNNDTQINIGIVIEAESAIKALKEGEL